MERIRQLGLAFSAFTAFAVGIITLLSLLLGDNPALFGDVPGSDVLAGLISLPAAVLVRLVAVTVAITLIIGIANLLYVHLIRLTRGAFFSIVLLGSFALTIYAYAVNGGDTALLESIQVPIESSLAALLFLSLLYGAARVMQKRRDGWGVLFIAVLLLLLLGTLPLDGLEPLREWSRWLSALPVSAGARGILLGIALAVVVAGLRVLLGQDRSYRG